MSSSTQTSDDERPTPMSGKDVYDWLVWQYAAARNKFHKGMLMHSLARDYYKVRAYWLHFLPLLGVTLLISILSFYVENNTTNIQHAISILGVLSTLLTSIGKYFNYQTQTDVHHNAYMALKDVWDRELFQADWERKFKKSIIKKVASITFTGEDDFKELSEKMDSYSLINVKKLMELYESIEKGCNGSDIPIKIRQAFDMLGNENHHQKAKNWNPSQRRIERANLKLWRLYYSNRSHFPKTFFPWYIQEFNIKSIIEGARPEGDQTNDEEAPVNATTSV